MRGKKELFEEQCKRRFGTANPERMRLAHWEWMVRYGEGPWGVREDLGLEHHYHDCGPNGCISRNEPDWCFKRSGMSRTRMPDGRIICIAGEHEDYYDPDFCIYNDVIVLRPARDKNAVDMESGEVEIYGYPESVFAPTDFHSATLVRDRIYVIGRLGYGGTRIAGVTPIIALNSATYEIEQRAAAGPAPGWIYKHHASFEEARNAIIVRGGKIDVEGATKQTPHFGAHRLHLDGLRWEVVSSHETHRRFLVEAEEGNREFREASEATFRPASMPYRWLEPEDRGVPVYGLDLNGVRVTFMEFFSQVRVLVEGELSRELVDQTLKDVVSNLARDTGSDWNVREVEQFES